MTTTTFTNREHEDALDLAADALDFGLSPAEARELERHLDGCESCRIEAAVMADDDELLNKSIRWDDEDYEGEDDEYTERPPRSEEDDDEDFSPESDRDPDEPVSEREDDSVISPPRSTESDDDDEADDDASDDDDDVSVDQSAPREASDDDLGSDDDDAEDGALVGRIVTEDNPDGDDFTPTGSDAEDEFNKEHEGHGPSDFGSGSGDGSEAENSGVAAGTMHDAEEEAEAVARALAEAKTDDELGDVDEDPTRDDKVFPDCVVDAVEDTARRNSGLGYMSDLRKRAVRNEDKVSNTQYGSVAVYRSIKGLTGDRSNDRPTASSYAAGAIRNAILRSRTGRSGTERYQKRGRLDGKGLHRIAMNDDRIFKRNTAVDPGKFLIWVMVDCSASMSGSPITDAAVVARALADATVGTPTVRMAIWGWSTPFRKSDEVYTRGYGATAGVVKIWESGQPTGEVFRLTELNMGGTPDCPVLDWAWKEIRKQAKSGETPVIIMASDGWGGRQLPLVIEDAARHGVLVKSVALGDYIHEIDQESRFGRGNYVPWTGTIDGTARPLATMIAKMAAGQ